MALFGVTIYNTNGNRLYYAKKFYFSQIVRESEILNFTVHAIDYLTTSQRFTHTIEIQNIFILIFDLNELVI